VDPIKPVVDALLLPYRLVSPLFEPTRPPTGAPPGALVAREQVGETRLRAVLYDSESLDETTPTMAEVADLLRDGRHVWIDIEGLGNLDMLEQVAAILGIHKLALADIANAPQRPHHVAYPENHLIIVRSAHGDPQKEAVLEQVSIVMGKGWVATFRESGPDPFEVVRERLRRATAEMRVLGATYLCYALIDTLVDAYYPLIEEIGERLEALDESIAAGPRRGHLREVHGLHHALVGLSRPVRQHRDLLADLLHGRESPFSGEVSVYLRDTHDHAEHILDALNVANELAHGLMDLHLSSVNLRMNEVMKILTIMASLFIPPTFVASVYGMNFENMPELRAAAGYPIALGIMLALIVGMLAFFRRRGWLGREIDDEDPGADAA